MKSSPFKFIFLILLVGGMTFLLFRPFAYAIAIAAIVVLVILGLYYSITWLANLYRKFRIRNTIEGILEDKVKAITKQISLQTQELKTIRKELADIDVQLQQEGLSSFARDKLIRLKDAFEIEDDLKNQKLDFYQLTLDKYDQLLSDQKVLKEITNKKATLKEVRNEDGTIPMESDRHISSEKEMIEELDYLTLRMDNTVHIDEAKEIHQELILLER